MTKYVFIVDPKGHILTNDSVLSRHVEYARGLNAVSQGQLKLGVIKPTFCQSNVELHQDLVIMNISMLRLLIPKHLGGNSIFTSEERPSLLIAGDPWLAGILTLYISKKLKTKNKVQIQLHGDFGNRRWIQNSLRNRLKYIMARLVVKQAAQVRSVSITQANLISKAFKVNMSKILVAPVPMLLWRQRTSSQKTFSATPRVGLVGRIHHDRGLGTFIDLVKKLVNEEREFIIHIVGSGPQENWLKEQFKLYFPQIQVKFFGEVKANNMRACWESLDLLISCAPTESYGRAAREALFFGVPVLATQSSGLIALDEARERGFLEFFETDSDSKFLACTFDRLLETPIPPDFRKTVSAEDEQNFNIIIEEWIDLANSISQN
jgi:glycosyltransferase involved in cell wall biosynthesis